MTQDELEEELFLAMLRESRENGGSTDFNLFELIQRQNISASPDALISFAQNNDGVLGSKKSTGIGGAFFKISAEGLRHAKAIEEARRSPTVSERVKALPVGKGAWDVFKIGLGVILGVIATKYFG